jgi:hypothetical protein
MTRTSGTACFVAGLLLASSGIALVGRVTGAAAIILASALIVSGLSLLTVGARARGELRQAGGAMSVLIAILVDHLLGWIGFNEQPLSLVVSTAVMVATVMFCMWLWPHIEKRLA